MTILGPSPITKCPSCGKHIQVYGYLSMNTFGARRWTDFRVISPMAPSRSMLRVCPHCSHSYWHDEAEHVGEVEPHDKATAHYPDALYGIEPKLEDYMNALSKYAQDDKKNEYIRIRLMWAGNDYRRDPKVLIGVQGSESISSEYERENLEALIPLLSLPELPPFSREDEGRKVLLSEVYRELGKFDECLNVLPKYPRDHLKIIIDLIRKLAEHRDSVVAEIINCTV